MKKKDENLPSTPDRQRWTKAKPDLVSIEVIQVLSNINESTLKNIRSLSGLQNRHDSMDLSDAKRSEYSGNIINSVKRLVINDSGYGKGITDEVAKKILEKVDVVTENKSKAEPTLKSIK